MKKIENLIKLFPILTFLLIVASSIKMAIFYRVFNINIVEYVGVSEYIPLFLDDLHSLLYLTAFIMIGFLFGKATGLEQEKIQDKTKKEKKNIRIRNIIFIIVLIVGVPIIQYLRFDNWYERLEPLNLMFILVMIILIIIAATYEKVSKTFAIGWFAAILSIPIIISAYTDAYEIIDLKRSINYEIYDSNNRILSSKNVQFLGKSNDYIFLYNVCEKKSIIYPMKEINEIRIVAK